MFKTVKNGSALLSGLFLVVATLMVFAACSSDDDSDDGCTEQTWYADSDGDGFGDPNTTQSACDQPMGFVDNADDVDDDDADLNPNTVWQGAALTFTKADNADWTQEANQDRITDNVWITRADSMGIFNIVEEMEYMDNSSPADTEWSFGTTADINSLTFTSWEEMFEMGGPPNNLNKDMVVHLISDNIYIDIKFTAWTQQAMGGGFTYERSTPN